MALKPGRNIVMEDVSFFMNEVAERGGVVVLSTVGSGEALDQSEALVTYSAAPSGKAPVGFLMNDMVNIDQTRQHINYFKDEVQKGGKVTLATQGWLLTDRIIGTPTAGQSAYLGQSGYIRGTVDANINNSPLVGRFLSTKDEDGFAKVSFNFPMAQIVAPI